MKIASVSDHPLPIQATRLCELSGALSACAKILFLRNREQPKRSWIVLDIYALLHNINGNIFAPKGFTENVFMPTNTGILRVSQLSKEFPTFDTSLLIPFLCRLEFCQEISDWEVLSLIGQSPDKSDVEDVDKDSATSKNEGARNHDPKYTRSLSTPHDYSLIPNHPRSASCPLIRSSASTCDARIMSGEFYPNLRLQEKCLFFPGLISPEEPRENMWTTGVFEFYSGWCLKCENDQQFFSLRFLHLLLLRLSLGFGITKKSENCELSECTLWKNGLRWLSLDGIETIVEMVEDRKAVLLLTRMKKDSIMKGLQMRAAIIRKILKTKEEYCLQITTSESFIDPSHLQARCCYPVINERVDDLKRYDITLIAKAFCTESKFVLV